MNTRIIKERKIAKLRKIKIKDLLEHEAIQIAKFDAEKEILIGNITFITKQSKMNSDGNWRSRNYRAKYRDNVNEVLKRNNQKEARRTSIGKGGWRGSCENK